MDRLFFIIMVSDCRQNVGMIRRALTCRTVTPNHSTSDSTIFYTDIELLIGFDYRLFPNCVSFMFVGEGVCILRIIRE